MWHNQRGSCRSEAQPISSLVSEVKLRILLQQALQKYIHKQQAKCKYRRVAYGGVANFGGRLDHVTNGSRHFVGQNTKNLRDAFKLLCLWLRKSLQ